MSDLEGKPIEYDATGRMIRSWEISDKPDRAEMKYLLDKAKEAKESFQSGRLQISERFFDNFLSKSGKAMKISPQEMKSSPVFSSAMEENRKRFEDSIVKGEVGGRPHEFLDKILQLKDGEVTSLSKKGSRHAGDYWDKDINASTGLWFNDADQFSSTGSVKLRSLGELTAKRQKDMVEIDGEVYHTLVDKYDFNDESLFDKVVLKDYRRMEEVGLGKSFNTYGSQSQKLKGFVEIKDGRPNSSNFKWEDID